MGMCCFPGGLHFQGTVEVLVEDGCQKPGCFVIFFADQNDPMWLGRGIYYPVIIDSEWFIVGHTEILMDIPSK